MKIFNTENEKEIVYVQNSDILRLKYIDSTIANKIYAQYKNTIGDNNLMKFIRFENEDELNFFRNIDWIVDYRKVSQLSNHMLEYMIDEVEIEMNKVGNEYMNTITENKNQKQLTFILFKLLEYKKNFLTMLLELRYTDEKIDLPLAIDYYGITFSFDINNQIQASTTLDPNIFLFYKVDGSEFTDDDKVPNELIQQVSQIVIKKNQLNNCIKKKINVSITHSVDDKYLIMEINPVTKKKSDNLISTEKRLIKNRAKYSK